MKIYMKYYHQAAIPIRQNLKHKTVRIVSEYIYCFLSANLFSYLKNQIQTYLCIT